MCGSEGVEDMFVLEWTRGGTRVVALGLSIWVVYRSLGVVSGLGVVSLMFDFVSLRRVGEREGQARGR